MSIVCKECGSVQYAPTNTMAIKELAGHASLGTTQRYMHLSPSAKDSAIRLLNDRGGGDQGETTQFLSTGSKEIQ